MIQIDPVLAALRDRSAARRALGRWWTAFSRGPGRRPVAAAVAGHRFWRRSLQLRVVSITLVLSALLVAAFGWLVVSEVTDGLLDDRKSRAELQVASGGVHATEQIGGYTEPGDSSRARAVSKVLLDLSRNADPGSRVQVIIAPFETTAGLTALSEPARDAHRVIDGLARLRQLVRAGNLVRQYVTADIDSADPAGPVPYLVYGTLIRSRGGDLGLYYLFPLDREIGNAELVRNTVAVTGVTLVALLAMIAGLVTHLVVRPVRIAARTAQRLSAGLLDQRMEVRGEDDLARLAASFNQMAVNLQRQIVRLEEMSRLQRRFTSDVSHELRTPLTTVRMAADLMYSAREDFEPAVARSAEILQAELDRFEGLLTDLLEISRFDAGFAVLDAEPVDLVPLVTGAADRLTSLAERAGTELRMELPDEPVVVEIDPRRVERILRNLIGNAVEHGEGGPVLVTLGADDAAVSVTVRDRGIGLKPGEEKLVFNRFWRSDPSRARQTGGTGLGLSISVEDARLHGGWLEAWGAPGQGAQFRLTLPVRAGDRLVSAPLRLVPDDAVRHTEEPATPEATRG